MRGKYLVIFAVILIALAGCVPVEVKEKTHEQRVAAGAYINTFMLNGKTTQAQDQALVKECYKSLLLLDWALNDDEEAKKLFDGIKAAESK